MSLQTRNLGNFIGGKWAPASGQAFDSIDPATGDIIWQGAAATPSEVDAAFTAAKNAFEAWSQTPLTDRIAAAMRFKEIVTERKLQIAHLISRETGKVLWDATGEAGVLSAKVDISVTAYDERTGAKKFETGFSRAELRHRAHGVMAVLGPYNFPAHLPNGQIIPSLIAGNTVVFKPSEQTPAVGQALMQAYADAGFPDGVVNLVQGARETGGAVLDSDKLDGVLFTGSANTGAFIHKKFGGRPEIILALEMGGNNPLLAWDVKDAAAAASIILQSAFITTGQRCTCARRIILPEGQSGDAILEAIIAGVDAMKIGAWDDEDEAFMGPLISADIAGHVVKSASALGGKTIRPSELMERGGAFVRPAIIDVTGISVKDEEIFGPVMQVIRAGSFEDGLRIANDTRFGLSAGLISDMQEHWATFTRSIRAGVVNFNRPTTGASGALPFGGPGASGNHNPGAFYAADACAWPMASQISDSVEFVASKGIPS